MADKISDLRDRIDVFPSPGFLNFNLNGKVFRRPMTPSAMRGLSQKLIDAAYKAERIINATSLREAVLQEAGIQESLGPAGDGRGDMAGSKEHDKTSGSSCDVGYCSNRVDTTGSIDGDEET